MKKAIRFILSFILLSSVVFLVACSTTVPTFRFVKHALSVATNETVELELLNESTEKDVAYTIESVTDDAGTAVSDKAYSTYITLSATRITDGKNCYAQAGSLTGTVKVKAYLVNEPDRNSTVIITIEPTRVSSMQITESVATLAVGTSALFKATSTPASGNQGVTWSSSNPAIASIEADGTVTAKAVKTSQVSLADFKKNQGALVTITATSTSDTTMSAKKTLLVTAAAATSVTILGNSGTDYEEKTEIPLSATVSPDAAYDYISWTSSDPTIASVDSTGRVTTQEKGGAVTITATTVDGVSSTTTLSVAYLETTAITMTPKEYSMVIGATYTITQTALKLEPTSANPNVTYTVVNPAIATVTDGILTALSAGTTVIHVTSYEGTLTTDFTLTVFPVPTSYDSITLIQPASTTVTVTYEADGSITIVSPTAQVIVDFTLNTTPAGAVYGARWSAAPKTIITSCYGTSDNLGRMTIKPNVAGDTVVSIYYSGNRDIKIDVTIHVVKA